MALIILIFVVFISIFATAALLFVIKCGGEEFSAAPPLVIIFCLFLICGIWFGVYKTAEFATS